jgi:hypothetical protein
VTPISGMHSTDDVPRLRRRNGTPQANTRLTALTGSILLVLFAAQGFTILFIGRLVTVHIFIGLLLIGPVCLKIGSTGYRFLRYYTGAPAYRREGRPAQWLRVLGPFVVLTSAALLASGASVAFLGTQWRSIPLLLLHQVVFWCWLAVMSLHVLARVWRLPRLIGADLRPRPARDELVAPGRTMRWSTLAVALGAGLLLALTCVGLATDWAR